MSIQPLTLHPCYLLRQDGNRVILMSNLEEKYGLDQWFSFIHPFQAKLLSFIKGEKPFEEEVAEATSKLGVSPDVVNKFLMPLIENEKPITLRSKSGIYTSFPKQLLVPASSVSHRTRNYTSSDFEVFDKFDFQTNRLDYPISVNFELTMHCYVNCCYCYAKRKDAMLTYLPTEKVLSLIDEFKKDGVVTIDINGGEVMMHPGIDIILKRLNDNGYTPLVSTKIPLTEAQIALIKTLPNVRLQISLDSSNPSLLQQIVHAPADYIERMSKTLEMITDAGLTIDINTVITAYNAKVEIIEELLDYLSQYKCVKLVRLNPAGFSLYKKDFDQWSAKANELSIIKRKVPEWRKRYPFQLYSSSYEKMENCLLENRIKAFPERAYCTGNTRNAVVLPNGDVSVCEELYDHPQFVIGNLFNNTLKEIWHGEKSKRLYDISFTENSGSACERCSDITTCRTNRGVCWKSVLIAYGSEHYNYPDPSCPKAPFPYRKYWH